MDYSDGGKMWWKDGPEQDMCKYGLGQDMW